jgi:hypothetical protein
MVPDVARQATDGEAQRTDAVGGGNSLTSPAGSATISSGALGADESGEQCLQFQLSFR